MRPPRDRFALRQILPLFFVCCSACLATELPVEVENEFKSTVEEPLINLPEYSAPSPFRSVSRPRVLDPADGSDTLQALVQDAVASTRRRLLSTETNHPWQIMHGLLALRREFEIRKDGEIISGLDWVSSGPTFEGEPWFEKTTYGGRAHPYSRPWAFEGHANQFLAILSMSALPLDHQFQTPSGPITVQDMLEHAQKTINSKDEPTWTLWALSRYLPPDAEWKNNQGQSWSIERLVSIQTARPLQGSACGGTHGLFALAHARNIYLRSDMPLRGVWLEAEYKIRRYINTARVQQNSNGMLSSNYFRGRDYKRDFNKRMASAGHILEFLMMALPRDELQEPWVRRAIEATANDLLRNRNAAVRCSPLYHSVNALNIYLDRLKQQQASLVATTAEPDELLKPADGDNVPSLKSVPAKGISNSTEISRSPATDDSVVEKIMITPSPNSSVASDESSPSSPDKGTAAAESPDGSAQTGLDTDDATGQQDGVVAEADITASDVQDDSRESRPAEKAVPSESTEQTEETQDLSANVDTSAELQGDSRTSADDSNEQL